MARVRSRGIDSHGVPSMNRQRTQVCATAHGAVAVMIALAGMLAPAPGRADNSEPQAATPGRFGIGTVATAADISARNIDIMPDGEGLPRGSGSVARGRAVYEQACIQCHGAGGQGGSVAALAGGESVDPAVMAANRSISHTVGNYWPFATTLFDYTRRAMPQDQPGSLADDEVYAVTAYMLYLNGLVDADAKLDAASLPQVRMPAQGFFRPDARSASAAP